MYRRSLSLQRSKSARVTSGRLLLVPCVDALRIVLVHARADVLYVSRHLSAARVAQLQEVEICLEGSSASTRGQCFRTHPFCKGVECSA